MKKDLAQNDQNYDEVPLEGQLWEPCRICGDEPVYISLGCLCELCGR